MDHLRRGSQRESLGFKKSCYGDRENLTANSLSGLSEDPSAVGLRRDEEQQALITTTTVPTSQPTGPHPWEGPWIGELSQTCSPFNSPTQPVCQSSGKCRLTEDCGGLNEVTPLLRVGHAPGVETQLHYLSWTDPDCTGKGEAAEHLQHIDDIIEWENRAHRRVLIKGRR